MKKLHHIYTFLAALCVLASSLVSCSDHDVIEGTEGDMGTFRLGLSLTVPNMPGSRASFVEGAGNYENAINITGKDFRILLFDYDNNTLIAEIDPEKVMVIDNNTSLTELTYRSYLISAELDKTITTHTSIRFVVLANWGNYPALTVGTTTIDDLAGYTPAADGTTGTVKAEGDHIFQAASTFTAGDGKFIPMFGVKDCTGLTWQKNTSTWLGDLWMLRAVAKIEVRAAVGGPAIESVVLTRYNPTGTGAPKGVYAEAQYAKDHLTDGVPNYNPDGTQYNSQQPLTLPGDKNADNASSYAVQPGSDGVFVVYVPEYQILADPTKPEGDKVEDYAKLQVTFENSSRPYDIDFKYYTRDAANNNNAQVGDFFDIKRNYYYIYTLNLTSLEPEIRVDVLPYRAVTLKPNFGLISDQLNLDKSLVKLYKSTGDDRPSEVVTATDKEGHPIPADKITWTLAPRTEGQNVCGIKKNDDGTCTITTAKDAKEGRDVLIASVKDSKTGMDITAQCVIEVSERHLYVERTFIGLMPSTEETDAKVTFKVQPICETDEQGIFSYNLLNEAENAASDLDLDITIEVDGVPVSDISQVKGDQIPVFTVKSGKKTGTAHLVLTYEGPDPDNSGDRKKYTTYTEILIEEVKLSCFPTKMSVIVDQSSAITTTVTPNFYSFIPTVKYRSSNPDVATVDAYGVVRGIAPGTAYIEAYDDTDFSKEVVSDQIEVTVVSDRLVLMRNDGTTIASYMELLSNPAESVQLKAFAYSGDGSTDVTNKVTWVAEERRDVVTDKLTATGGLVTPVAGETGSFTIKATYTDDSGNEMTASCIVVLSKTRQLIIKEHPLSVSQYATIPMEAYVFPDANVATTAKPEITWTSSDENVIKFDASNKSQAEAVGPGQATITASTTYTDINGAEHPLTATSAVVVRGDLDTDVNSIKLVIYDENGNFVTEIQSEDKDYDGNAGGDNIFERINLPKGKTYTAKVVIDPSVLSVPKNSWTRIIRYSYHNERIILESSDDGLSCKIISNINPTDKEINASGVDASTTRYNEVLFKIKANGKVFSRRFCVYSPNSLTP